MGRERVREREQEKGGGRKKINSTQEKREIADFEKEA